MKDGFIRAAAISPKVSVADCEYNAEQIMLALDEAERQGCRIAVLPELAISAYSCGDLFLQNTLLDAAEREARRIAEYIASKNMIALVGCPVRNKGRLYNAALVMANGAIIGIVPKTYLPNYSEFYEARNFAPAPSQNDTAIFAGAEIPFGTKLIFRCAEMPLLTLAVEICEDMFVGNPPCATHTAAGARIVANLSASDEFVGKGSYRRDLVRMQSAKCCCVYVYACAGSDESTSGLVFAGHDIISQNGEILAESRPFGEGRCFVECDLQQIDTEQRRTQCNSGEPPLDYKFIEFHLNPVECELTRKYEPNPFVPQDAAELAERCETVFNIQSIGLARRLEHIAAKSAVIGVSGGLDSTLALLVAVKAAERAGLDRKAVKAVSMPCFGTSARTKSNAQIISEQLGVDFRIVDITDAVKLHLENIGHDGKTTDAAYENSQARERTQVLMDIANMTGGIVVGTGDLSELSLGWCTYNGDQMSMYSVNAGVPKTFIRAMVSYAAAQTEDKRLSAALLDIVDTPVSPELLPSDEKGAISQKTEDLVGPYELHDFFIYYMLRRGFAPSKVLRIAKHVFAGKFEDEVIEKWLKTFCRRFFNNQFKRSCSPDGPKVGTASLSPVFDWRMPSDAVSCEWLASIE